MVAVVGGSVFALVWCLLGGGNGGRLARLAPQSPASAPSKTGLRLPVDNPRLRSVMCVSACSAVGWLLSGWLSALVGLPAGLALSWWVGRLESPGAARAREEISRDLPLAADLLAACASVGRPVDDSLHLVSRAVGGTLGERLDSLTSRLALGAEPLNEWRRIAADPHMSSLARTMLRTLESGAPVVDGLTRLAQDRRRERRTETQLRARNVGVKAAAPLAACFLPAFMLIGVVPTIAGAFSNLVL